MVLSSESHSTPMNVAVDIGNSTMKFGVFDPERGNAMVGHWRMPSGETGWINKVFLSTMTCLGMLTNKINPPGKRAAGMEHIYPESLTWRIAQTGRFPLQKFKTEILALRPKDTFKTVTRKQIPIKKAVDSPETVGIDRLLAAFAAVKTYGDANMLVVDAGTAITVDVVQNRTFCGGAILPGLAAQSEIYPQISENLPLISVSDSFLTSSPVYPGRNTKEAIHNGLYWGAIGAIRQFYETFCLKRDKVLLILTGGDSKYLLPGLSQVIPPQRIKLHDILVLEGINRCFAE